MNQKGNSSHKSRHKMQTTSTRQTSKQNDNNLQQVKLRKQGGNGAYHENVWLNVL